MYTEKKEELRLPVMDIKMAIDNKPEFKRVIFERPTTEEHEKKKMDIALQFSKEMINTFSPEDRFDIFNDIRKEFEKALRQQCEEMAYRLESETKYFDGLKSLIY